MKLPRNVIIKHDGKFVVPALKIYLGLQCWQPAVMPYVIHKFANVASVTFTENSLLTYFVL